MKIARFNGRRIGVVAGSSILDVTTLTGPAEDWPPTEMVRLIAGFATSRPAIEAGLHGVASGPLSNVRLEAPIDWPNKVIAFPANYEPHRVEMRSRNRADINGFFLKANSSISGPSDPIVLPDLPGREIHHECELAIVIGKRARHIAPDNALDYVFGYTCLIDVTVRGTEERVMRKSYDTFCPMGPYLVTADEVGDPAALDLELSVNGQVRQRANTRDLILDIPNMIALAASVTTLFPGDVIATGTPAGVGPIRGGDRVTITIERIGSMTVPVVLGQGGSNIAFRKGSQPAAGA